jgi:hypothetical protein
MTHEEAVGMIGAIKGAWPSMFLDDYGHQAWESFLVGRDYDTTLKAYVRLSERQRDLPTIADFRGMIIALEADQRAAMPKIEEAEYARDLEDWVKGWAVGRYKHGDMRVWPEQRFGYDSIQRDNPHYRTYVWPDQEMMPDEEITKYTAEGSGLSVQDIFGLIG